MDILPRSEFLMREALILDAKRLLQEDVLNIA